MYDLLEDKQNVICRKVREEDLEMIMNWRMMPEITRYMNSDPKLTLENQYKWFDKIKKSKVDFYWVLEVDGVPSGLVSLVDMDKSNKSIQTGVYIAVKDKRSLKLTIEIQRNLYEYAFVELGMNKVVEKVFAINKAVNRILDMCGSKQEGVLRSHVYKNGQYYDIIVRGLLKCEWEGQKEKLRFHKIHFE